MADRLSALMAAHAVSLSARTGSLTQHAVDDMRGRAEQVMERHDPMRAAILSFSTMYEAHRRDPYAVEKLGEALERDLRDELSLTRVMRERRDIDG